MMPLLITRCRVYFIEASIFAAPNTLSQTPPRFHVVSFSAAASFRSFFFSPPPPRQFDAEIAAAPPAPPMLSLSYEAIFASWLPIAAALQPLCHAAMLCICCWLSSLPDSSPRHEYRGRGFYDIFPARLRLLFIGFMPAAVMTR